MAFDKEGFAGKAKLELLKKMRSSAAKKIPIKAEVAGDSPESVEKGLDLAKEVIGKKDTMIPEAMEAAEEGSEIVSEEPEMEVEGEESPEAKIAMLEEKLASMEERLSKLGV